MNSALRKASTAAYDEQQTYPWPIVVVVADHDVWTMNFNK
jgi:hypothetical protein